MNQNPTFRACLMLIALLQIPVFAAERPLKRQRVAAPSKLPEVIAISEQIKACAKTRAERTKLYPSMNFTLSAVELEKQRQPLVEKLTDEDYVQYLHYRFRGKVFEGDRLSRRELLQEILPAVIAKIADDYLWCNPNITAIRYMGALPKTHFTAYTCNRPHREVLVLNTSCRKDFEAGPLLFHILPQQQLQERVGLHGYLWKKPSEKDLERLTASKRYSKDTLLLLKEGTLFDAPVLEPIDEKEDS